MVIKSGRIKCSIHGESEKFLTLFLENYKRTGYLTA
jgi:hypothetical protein